MGPQLYRCGNAPRQDMETHKNGASMGPQLYRCGNQPRTQGTGSAHITLQWGRNFIVAETMINAKQTVNITMLQWGRNFIVAETMNLAQALEKAGGSFNGAATLSLRKLVPSRRTSRLLSVLQWGRNFIVAETHNSNVPFAVSNPCFNGAATLSLRKHLSCKPL